MDSMRSLDRSLPGSRESAEDVNAAFRAAAVSVTNLYKKAISGQAQARQAGYQDALDDLLSFLDRRNLGLQDGEGWLVRQWATKLLDDRPASNSVPVQKDEQHASDSEEEKEIEKEKSPSPAAGYSSPIHQSTERQTESEKTNTTDKPTLTLPTAEAFTFQSSHAYPKDIEMQVVEAASKREVSPRATRPRKPTKQKTSSAKTLGAGGGSKRRMPFGEFFDISDLTETKDEGRKPATRRKLA